MLAVKEFTFWLYSKVPALCKKQKNKDYWTYTKLSLCSSLCVLSVLYLFGACNRVFFSIRLLHSECETSSITKLTL